VHRGEGGQRDERAHRRSGEGDGSIRERGGRLRFQRRDAAEEKQRDRGRLYTEPASGQRVRQFMQHDAGEEHEGGRGADAVRTCCAERTDRCRVGDRYRNQRIDRKPRRVHVEANATQTTDGERARHRLRHVRASVTRAPATYGVSLVTTSSKTSKLRCASRSVSAATERR